MRCWVNAEKFMDSIVQVLWQCRLCLIGPSHIESICLTKVSIGFVHPSRFGVEVSIDAGNVRLDIENGGSVNEVKGADF